MHKIPPKPRILTTSEFLPGWTVGGLDEDHREYAFPVNQVSGDQASIVCPSDKSTVNQYGL
jgi:hypothetical protein